MKLKLLTSEHCNPCQEAKEMLDELAEEKSFEYCLIDVESESGKQKARELDINVVPTILLESEKEIGPFVLRNTSYLKTGLPERENLERVIDKCLGEDVDKDDCERAMEAMRDEMS